MGPFNDRSKRSFNVRNKRSFNDLKKASFNEVKKGSFNKRNEQKGLRFFVKRARVRV